jgi:hypothetical protein
MNNQLPPPATVTELYLAAILVELRKLNTPKIDQDSKPVLSQIKPEEVIKPVVTMRKKIRK